MEPGAAITPAGGSGSSGLDQLPDNGVNSPSTSRAAGYSLETLPKVHTGGEGESKQTRTLLLRHPRHLYRFENVGAVFAFSRVGALHIEVEIDGGAKMPVDIPGGNWILIGVGAMDALDVSGFVTYDNTETEGAK